MFVIIRAADVLAHTDDPYEAIRMSADHAMNNPDDLVTFAEIVVPFADPRTAIPGELDRAIDEWNAMTNRVKKKGFHINRIEKRGPVLIKAYRKWRDAIGSRPYLLEQLPTAVEEQSFLWPTVTFGWLFSVDRQTGEFRSDKVHARAYGKGGNGSGKVSESAFIGLAKTVAIWKRETAGIYAGDDGAWADAFERAIGITPERFVELKKQFNGASL